MKELLFKLGYQFRRPNVLAYYKLFMKSQWLKYEELEKRAEEQLRKIISYAHDHVPYYKELFANLNISVNDIKTKKDLQKLPILTKEIIKMNYNAFIPDNIKYLKYINGSTGGSTGIPLKYRMSLEDYERGIALLYRGWGMAGYRLGDKLAILAGTSLIPDSKTDIKKRFFDFILNHKSYSSYNLSENNLNNYYRSMNYWKPEFIRGYASSVYLFAKYIDDNNLKMQFHPKAIFTTAEKLSSNQRKLIEKAFDSEVFDNYGLNDGGISAFECPMHKGLHVDMERAILEVVDENGMQIFDRPGKILATSLFNYALPFIRYDTGDLGILSSEGCSCGRETFLLKELIGRTTDSLLLNGISIGSPILTVLMGKYDIGQYQIIQKSDNCLIIKIVKGKNFSPKDEELIRKSLVSHVGAVDIKFEYVDSIRPETGNKHKFIIREQ
jgi:phenylacetate-CoA ligase